MKTCSKMHAELAISYKCQPDSCVTPAGSRRSERTVSCAASHPARRPSSPGRGPGAPSWMYRIVTSDTRMRVRCAIAAISLCRLDAPNRAPKFRTAPSTGTVSRGQSCCWLRLQTRPESLRLTALGAHLPGVVLQNLRHFQRVAGCQAYQHQANRRGTVTINPLRYDVSRPM